MTSQYNDNANNAKEEAERKVDRKDGTISRNQKDNRKDTKRVAETKNGMMTVDRGKKKERAKTKDTEIETKRNEEERKTRNENDKEQSKGKDKKK